MFKYLAEDEIPEQLQKMKLKVKENLLKQTEVWHRTSKKKVAAGMYIQKYDDYIVAQNVGLSLVTGSICAERALIVSAVAKYPDLKIDVYQPLANVARLRIVLSGMSVTEKEKTININGLENLKFNEQDGEIK